MTLFDHASGLRTQLVLGFVSLTLTAALVYLAGLMILPTDTDAVTEPASGPALPSVGDLSGSQAIVVVSGEHERRLVMDHLTISQYNEDIATGDPLRLSLAYRNSTASLLITARDITIDSPAQGERASAMLGLQGGNYLGNKGECTVTIETLDYAVLEPMPQLRVQSVPRGVPIPVYSGTVDCKGVKDIRSDGRVDLYAVFQYLPEQ